MYCIYIVIVVCNVNSLYKSQEHRLSYCCLTTLQPATIRLSDKFRAVFMNVILINTKRLFALILKVFQVYYVICTLISFMCYERACSTFKFV